jgi:hypothetical protein
MLTTLIYRSQVDPDRPLSISTLYSSRQRKNTPLGITGILLFNGLQFSRCWKERGESRVVIQRNTKRPRHRDVVELMRDYSAYRRFRHRAHGSPLLKRWRAGEILRFSTFGVTEPVNDRMFRLISAIADGGRYCLPEPLLQPSRWMMMPASVRPRRTCPINPASLLCRLLSSRLKSGFLPLSSDPQPNRRLSRGNVCRHCGGGSLPF